MQHDCINVSVTSDIVADAGSEAAPPGDDAPLKHFSIDAAWFHGDDCLNRCVKEPTALPLTV